MEWVSVKEGLPEKSQLVDVWHNGIRFMNFYLTGDQFESRQKYCADEKKDIWKPKYIFKVKSVDFWFLPESPR